MVFWRALALSIILAALPLSVKAQSDNVPGMQGSVTFGRLLADLPPACQPLLAMRDETQKNASAIQKAGEKKAGADVACKLFKTFLASETKMIKAIESNIQLCGIPPEMPKQMKAGHAKAEQIAKRVCDAAARIIRSGELNDPRPFAADPPPRCPTSPGDPGYLCYK